MSRTKLTALSTTPTSMLTRSSFQNTLRKSLSWISPTAMPRMIRVLLWLPAFPPVSVSMGMKVTSRGMAEKAASYLPRMPPVIMPRDHQHQQPHDAVLGQGEARRS